MSKNGVEVVGVGSPLMDLVLQVDDAFVAKHAGGAKGGMELMSHGLIEKILHATPNKPVQAAGGSAANITVGCAQLGIGAAFIGCRGNDTIGAAYGEALQAQGCEPRLLEHPHLPTGHVLSLVTPDGERTMRTCLGAAAELDADHFKPEVFAGAKLVIMEGYMLFNRELTMAVAQAAKNAGCLVALDFASFEVVNAHRAIIHELLDGPGAGGLGPRNEEQSPDSPDKIAQRFWGSGLVDIVLANGDEAKAWHDDGHEAALHDLAGKTMLTAVKLGKDGALIARDTERTQVRADVVTAVDTTGAGDCWAAGFLSAFLRGLPLDACGKVASKAGAAVVQVIGAQMDRERWLAIRGHMDAWA
jgi:sugar/nucleoside kinase (ribokinase family)